MSVRLTNSDISYDCFYIMRFEWKLHVMYRRPSSSNKSKVSKQTDMWLFTYSPVLTVASTETRVWLPIHQGCRRRQITTSRVNILIPKTLLCYIKKLSYCWKKLNKEGFLYVILFYSVLLRNTKGLLNFLFFSSDFSSVFVFFSSNIKPAS